MMVATQYVTNRKYMSILRVSNHLSLWLLLASLLFGGISLPAFEFNNGDISLEVKMPIDKVEVDPNVTTLQSTNIVIQISKLPYPAEQLTDPEITTTVIKFLTGFKKENSGKAMDERVFEGQINNIKVFCGEEVVRNETNGLEKASILFKKHKGTLYELHMISPPGYSVTNVVSRFDTLAD